MGVTSAACQSLHLASSTPCCPSFSSRHIVTLPSLDARGPCCNATAVQQHNSSKESSTRPAALHGGAISTEESEVSSFVSWAYDTSGCISPVSMSQLSAAMEEPSSPPLRPPQPPEAVQPLAHEAVSRCLFQAADASSKPLRAPLPRLIVPAHPFSSCYAASTPMQAPTPAPAAAADAGGRPPATRAESVQDWLSAMEHNLLSSGSSDRSPGAHQHMEPLCSMGPAAASEEADAAAGPSTDLPEPAFVLLGLLQ